MASRRAPRRTATSTCGGEWFIILPIEASTQATRPSSELLLDGRGGLRLLERAFAALESVAPAGDLTAARERLARLAQRYARDVTVVALLGPRVAEALTLLVGAEVGAMAWPPETVRVRVRHAAAAGFVARFGDDSAEESPPDEGAALQVRLDRCECEHADAAAAIRNANERLQEAARVVAQARAELAAAEHDLAAARHLAGLATTDGAARGASLDKLQRLPELARASPSVRRGAMVRVSARLRAWWAGWLAWLAALVRRLRGAAPTPATPVGADATAASPPLAPRLASRRARGERVRPTPAVVPISEAHAHLRAVEARVRERVLELPRAVESVEQCEAALAAAKLQLTAIGIERDRLRRDLDKARADRPRVLAARLTELARAELAELELQSPLAPEGVVVVCGGAAEAEPIDATLEAERLLGDSAAEALAQLQRERPRELASRLADMLAMCRERIHEATARASRDGDERLAVLRAFDVEDVPARRDLELANVQRAIAALAAEVTTEAVHQLELRLGEVRHHWQERIAGCVAAEQLPTEAAAIEDGAKRRLSLVCDELRETMTLRSVRSLLEMLRPLRQELLRRRADACVEGPPAVEPTFEAMRVKLPASLEATFAAMSALDLGALELRQPRLLDSWRRTVERDKRELTAKLEARVDEIIGTTTRELFAATVYLSQLLGDAYGALAAEMLTVHHEWVAARLVEATRAVEEARAATAPLQSLLPELERKERRLAQLLERTLT